MTDFLEELLKDQEEENQEQMWKVLSNRPAPIQGTSRDTGINTADLHSRLSNELLQETKTASLLIGKSFWDNKQPQKRFGSMDTDGTLYVEKRVRETGNSGELNGDIPRTEISLADSMKRIHRAVRIQVKPNTQTAGSPARISGQDGGFYRNSAEKEQHVSSYAALVDAAFARDARRYDGPLRLL